MTTARTPSAARARWIAASFAAAMLFVGGWQWARRDSHEFNAGSSNLASPTLDDHGETLSTHADDEDAARKHDTRNVIVHTQRHHGFVVDESGAPIGSAIVTIASAQRESKADGSFEFAFVSDSDSVRATNSEFDVDSVRVTVRVTVRATGFLANETRVPRSEDLGRIVLKRAELVILGTVLLESGEAAVDADIQVAASTASFTGTIHPAAVAEVLQQAAVRRPVMDRCRSDALGHFELAVSERAPWFVIEASQSTMLGGVSVACSPSAKRVDCTIVLTPRLRIQGLVVDASRSPQSDARVVLLPNPETTRTDWASVTAGVRETRTDKSGRFTFDAVQQRAVLVGVEQGSGCVLRLVQPPFDALLEIVIPPTGTLRGRVADSATNAPISGAAIDVLCADASAGAVSARARTDDGGSFVLDGLPIGPIAQLSVSSAGYAPASTTIAGTLPSEAVFDVRRGDDSAHIDVRLPRGSVFQARLETQDGRPVAAAEVELVGHGGRGRGSARSDDNGRVQIDGLHPGAYRIDVRHASFVRRSEDEVVRVAEEPGTLPVRIVLVEACALTGRVETALGEPIAGVVLHAIVHSMVEGPNDVTQSVSGKDGTFQIEHLPPNARLDLDVDDPRFLHFTLETSSPDGGVLELGPIVLGQGATLDGYVVDSAGALVLDANVSLAHGATDYVGIGRGVSTGATGSFHLARVALGRSWILVRGPHQPSKRFVVDDIVAAEHRTGLRIVLAPGHDIVGQVLDRAGNALSGAIVRAQWSLDEPVAESVMRSATAMTSDFFTRTSITVEGGRFELARLPETSMMMVVAIAPGFEPSNRAVPSTAEGDLVFNLKPEPPGEREH